MATEAAERVGGQAVIEGVVMRAGDRAHVAVRRPDGTIATRALEIPGWAERASSLVLVRGLAALAEALVVGVRALRWSEEQAGMRPPDRRPAPTAVLVAIALVVVVGLVVVVPSLLAGLVPAGWAAGTVEAVSRIAVLATYVGAVTRRREVRRVFEYHGAEHVVVSAHEAGTPLEPSRLRDRPLHHPRCGTSFVLVVAAVATIVHPLLPHASLGARVGLRVAIVPLVAAGAYEVLRTLGRWAERRPGGRSEALLLWPQRFTTRPPDDDQLEVAIVALQGALGVDAPRPPAEPWEQSAAGVVVGPGPTGGGGWVPDGGTWS